MKDNFKLAIIITAEIKPLDFYLLSVLNKPNKIITLENVLRGICLKQNILRVY